MGAGEKGGGREAPALCYFESPATVFVTGPVDIHRRRGGAGGGGGGGPPYPPQPRGILSPPFSSPSSSSHFFRSPIPLLRCNLEPLLSPGNSAKELQARRSPPPPLHPPFLRPLRRLRLLVDVSGTVIANFPSRRRREREEGRRRQNFVNSPSSPPLPRLLAMQAILDRHFGGGRGEEGEETRVCQSLPEDG